VLGELIWGLEVLVDQVELPQPHLVVLVSVEPQVRIRMGLVEMERVETLPLVVGVVVEAEAVLEQEPQEPQPQTTMEELVGLEELRQERNPLEQVAVEEVVF